MGEFAADVAKRYQTGAARGNLSILSAMEIAPAGFFANFGQSINDLILAHRSVLEKKRKLDATSTRRHAAVGPKGRWVDGTPEYSLHVCGLRKLFPEALFIHLVRNVDAVVRSLLNFHRISGIHLVANEEDAYQYWLRRARACLKAEQAYGPKVVRRVLYSSLIENPESAMQSLLSFVGEPYSANCLEPLGERINSSNVPPDFKSDDPATDPAMVEEARRLSAEMEQTAQPSEPSTAAAHEMEIAFQGLYVRASTVDQELTGQIARQQQHYTGEIARQERHYKNRLHKQGRDIQQLAAMLDEIAASTASMRSSSFWKIVNRVAALEAKLFRTKALAPDRRLQKVLANYARWRASQPGIATPNEPIDADESPFPTKSSNTELERLSEAQVLPKVSGNSANA
jgi:Sulfotransferase family